MPPAENWHLDKKVVVSLIIAVISTFGGLVVQTVYLTAWGTQKYDDLNNRVAILEKSDDGQQSHETRLTILEQQFGYIRTDLAEIKNLLRRQIPKEPNQ